MQRCILVIDDEPEVADVVQVVLERQGFAVLTASDGRRGLEALAALGPERQPCLIICDMSMPVMDGLTFLREYAHRARAPVLAYSAVEPYLIQAQALGAAATLRKPFELAELLSAVQKTLAGAPPAPPKGGPPDASPEAERRRVREITECRLDAPELNDSLNSYLQRVARLFEVPLALVSMITETRQYWTSGFGIPPDLLAARGTVVGDSFCVHAVAARSPLVVQNAIDNPFFKSNRLVQTHGLRFYAGVPVFTRSGEAVGTLCIIDYRERLFTHEDLDLLRVLARRVMAELEAHERALGGDRLASGFRHASYLDPELNILGRAEFLTLLGPLARRSASTGKALALVVTSVPQPEIVAAARALIDGFADGWFGRLSATRLGILAVNEPSAVALERARGQLAPHAPHARIAALDANARLQDAITIVRDAEALLGPATAG